MSVLGRDKLTSHFNEKSKYIINDLLEITTDLRNDRSSPLFEYRYMDSDDVLAWTGSNKEQFEKNSCCRI